MLFSADSYPKIAGRAVREGGMMSTVRFRG